MQSDTSTGHGVSGFFNNAHTAVTRRFKNILTDDRTHSVFELILGNDPASSVDCGPSFATRTAAAALAEEAQALPCCDDVDSDGDEDPLSLVPWPARSAPPPGTGSASSLPGLASNPLSPTHPATPQVTSQKAAQSTSDLDELARSSSVSGIPQTPSSALNELRGAPSTSEIPQETSYRTAQATSEFQGLDIGAGALDWSSQRAAPDASAAAQSPCTSAMPDLLSLDDELPSTSLSGSEMQTQTHAPQLLHMQRQPGAIPSSGSGGTLHAASNDYRAGEFGAGIVTTPQDGPARSSLDNPFAACMSTDNSNAGLRDGKGQGEVDGNSPGQNASSIDVGKIDDSKQEFWQVKIRDTGLIDHLGSAGEQQTSLL
jgi:hypothetical protein